MKNFYFTLYYNICGQILKNSFLYLINEYFLKYFTLKINNKIYKTLIHIPLTNAKRHYLITSQRKKI